VGVEQQTICGHPGLVQGKVTTKQAMRHEEIQVQIAVERGD